MPDEEKKEENLDICFESEATLQKEVSGAVQNSDHSSVAESYEEPVSSTPLISLGPTRPSIVESDPYHFPSSDKALKKKNRRRSSGSIGYSGKDQIASCDSPRTPNITPLRQSIGKLKRTSIPLVEGISEDDASPTCDSAKKVWEPLPVVEEVENNSSPIKKHRHSLRELISTSPLVLDESLQAVRRKSRVSFGPKLSPEQFLKHLPPNTPVKKGATPNEGEVIPRRKSIRLSSLCTVVEADSPTQTAKPVRTPTPYKHGNKSKQMNLLQDALRNAMDKQHRLVDKFLLII